MAKKTDTGTIIFDTSFGKEKEYFLENFALLLNAGIPIEVALESLKSQIKSIKLKRLVSKIETSIDTGSPLWEAFEKTDMFPAPSIALIRIGEQSGNLPKNINLIINQQQKDREFKSQIKSALLYPLIILCVTVGTLVGITWFVLPRIARLFNGLQVELPLITKIILQLGNIMNSYGLHITVGLIITIILASVTVTKITAIKLLWEQIILKTPGISTVIQQIELARFGFILSSLLNSSIPVSIALDSLSKASTFHSYQKFYAEVEKMIIDGQNFRESFQSIKNSKNFIPLPYQQMIFVGEQTGKLSETLAEISRIFEAKAQLAHKTLSTILEPLLVVFMALGVGTVSLAIILPVYSLVNGINAEVQTASAPPPPPTSDSTPLPTPTSQQTETLPAAKRIEILPNQLGYVNVRSQPTTTAPILQQAQPSETYELFSETEDWYEIVLENDQTGWVHNDFVRPLSQEN